MWLIFKKEILELLRDRKTLFFVIALPIAIFPLIIGAMIYFMVEVQSEAQSKVLKYAIAGEQYAPDLVAKLGDVETFELIALNNDMNDTETAKEAVRNGDVDFVLQIPSNYGNQVLSSGQITLNIVLNDAKVNAARSRIVEVTDIIEEDNQRAAFAQLGVDEDMQKALINPILVKKVNVADEREQTGSALGGMIPYIMFLLCLQGAMMPAADIGAGEKERGTLETLLLSPVDRHKIVLAKFATIATAGVTTALITVSSIALWGLIALQFIPAGDGLTFMSELMSTIDWIDFALIFFMLVPVVAIFASVLLAMSIYARSFKEAQGYMSPLMIFVFIPVIIALIPGIELKGMWAWIPLTNVALAIKELVKGTMDYLQLFAIFGSTVVLAGALLAFCVYWFKQEKVLFR
ncbi:MAG: ABC transporter permease [Glaciecola sp.]